MVCATDGSVKVVFIKVVSEKNNSPWNIYFYQPWQKSQVAQYSQCGPRTYSISTNWELVKTANSWDPLHKKIYFIRNVEGDI